MALEESCLSLARRRSCKPPPTCSTRGRKGERITGRQREALRTWAELDGWQQLGNQFVETGYRTVSNDFRACLESLTYIHNETVNIYSHLVGSALFIAIPVYLFYSEVPPRYSVATCTDILVCLTYFVGVAVCFCLSAVYHISMHHSLSTQALGVQLDFQGVVVLMWSATVPLIYYGFHDDFTFQVVYGTSLLILAGICSLTTFHSHFQGPFSSHVRVATFGSLGLVTMVPVWHGGYVNGWEEQSQRIGVKWVLLTVVFNILGALAYAFKIPERWWRRKFDIFGASHQIFHVMVVLAALTYTKGILQAFDFVHAQDMFLIA